MRSEFEFINRVREQIAARRRDPRVRCGIGDDAAVIKHSSTHDLVISADLLVEDIDFRHAWISTKDGARALGHKALAVSLSDIAAMGARPRFSLLSIGVPANIWRTKFLDHFYEGFFRLADEHNIPLIGGDVSRTTDKIVIDSVAIGEVQRGRAVLRSGARAGDQIYVTGELGGAAAGLQLLESSSQEITKRKRDSRHQHTQHLLARQQRPTPRVACGLRLNARRLATAMIDISDGLSSDLAHLCQASGVGATIDARLLPIDHAMREIVETPLAESSVGSFEPLRLTLNGGEDYELLFTVRTSDAAKVPRRVAGVKVTRIGEMTDDSRKIMLYDGEIESVLSSSGFAHFKS